MRLKNPFVPKKRHAMADSTPQIGGVTRHFWEKPYRRGFSGGDWVKRNQPLFEFGIDFRDKTILDAGCNIGIVGYELSKFAPAYYHGIDNYQAALEVALAIFSGVSVDFRFDRVDIGDERGMASILRPSYDIVLFLGVYTYLHNRYGEPGARQLLATLAGHCSDRFIAADSRSNIASLVETVEQAGFTVEVERMPSEGSKKVWFVFKRSQPTSPA